MPSLINSDLAQNYRKTAPSSMFGTRDMAFYGIFLAPYEQNGATPFPINFLGNDYTSVYVGTNGYVTFGDGTDVYNFGTDATMDGAELPAILVSEADNSYQFVYTKTTGDIQTESRQFTIRYEGSSDTQAVFPRPNMVWEMTFYEALPGIVDLLILKDGHNSNGSGVSGVTNGSAWVDDYFDGHNAGWGVSGFRIDTSDGTTAKVTRITIREKSSEGMQIEHQFNHDTGGSTNNHDENNDFVRVHGMVWNGSDYAKAVRALQQVVELYYVGQPSEGMGVDFVVAVADDTATYNMMLNALYNVRGPSFGIVPMAVGPESIYVDL